MTHRLIHPDTHLDHGLTSMHLTWLLAELDQRWRDERWFDGLTPEELASTPPLVATFEMPAHLDPLPCALWGPNTSGAPVPEENVRYVKRGSRTWTSRVAKDPGEVSLRSRKVTAVLGPHEGKIILYTVYGGPQAPREPGDPNLPEEARAFSEKFWSEHALVWEEK